MNPNQMSNEKRIGCMCLAYITSMGFKFPMGGIHWERANDDWHRLYKQLCERFTEKAIIRKMEKLAMQGITEYGVSARTGWLTPKGMAIFDELVKSKAA